MLRTPSVLITIALVKRLFPGDTVPGTHLVRGKFAPGDTTNWS